MKKQKKHNQAMKEEKVGVMVRNASEERHIT
jgi:hypothetical protein